MGFLENEDRLISLTHILRLEAQHRKSLSKSNVLSNCQCNCSFMFNLINFSSAVFFIDMHSVHAFYATHF